MHALYVIKRTSTLTTTLTGRVEGTINLHLFAKP
jgi:hypothetical protein